MVSSLEIENSSCFSLKPHFFLSWSIFDLAPVLLVFVREILVILEVRLAFRQLFEDQNNEFSFVIILASLGLPLGFLLNFDLKHLPLG